MSRRPIPEPLCTTRASWLRVTTAILALALLAVAASCAEREAPVEQDALALESCSATGGSGRVERDAAGNVTSVVCCDPASDPSCAEPVPQAIDPRCECPMGEVFDEASNQCVCPPGTSAGADGACVASSPGDFKVLLRIRSAGAHYYLGALNGMRGYESQRSFTLAGDTNESFTQTQSATYYYNYGSTQNTDAVWIGSRGTTQVFSNVMDSRGNWGPLGAGSAYWVGEACGVTCWYSERRNFARAVVLCAAFDYPLITDDAWDRCAAAFQSVPSGGVEFSGGGDYGISEARAWVDALTVPGGFYGGPGAPPPPTPPLDTLDCSGLPDYDPFQDLPTPCATGWCERDPNGFGPAGDEAGEPVELRFGSFYEHVEGLSLPSLGPALDTGLRYSSRQALAGYDLGQAGPGWTSTYTRRLLRARGDDGSELLHVLAEDGRSHRYREEAAGSGRYVLLSSPAASVIERDGATGAYVRTDRDGRVERYDATGALRSVTDASGNALTLVERTRPDGAVEQELTDVASGLALVRVYAARPSGAMRLVEIRDAATNLGPGETTPLRQVRLEYDDLDRLVAVVDPAGVPMRFAYDGEGRVVEVRDRNYAPDDPEHGPLRIEYEGDSARVTRQVMSNGVRLDFEWQALPDPVEADSKTLVVRYTDDAGTHARAFLHDPVGRIVRRYVLDHPSAHAAFVYDERHGRLAESRDAEGRVTRYEYDPDTRDVLHVTVAPGTTDESIWTFGAYHPSGQPTEIRDPEGRVTRHDYDAAARPLAVRRSDGLGEELATRWTYDDRGLPISVEHPDGSRTSYAYDERGHVVRQVADADGLAIETRFVRDFAGRVLREEGPDGVVRTFERDVVGRVVATVTDPGGANERTTFTYDGRHNVTERREPDGRVWRFDHVEAGDTFDRPAVVIDPEGLRIETEYDALGRIAEQRWVEPSGQVRRVTQTTSTEAAGVVTQTTSPDGAVHREERDLSGRLRRSIAANGVTEELGYDAAGRAVTRVEGAAALPDGTPAIGATTRLRYDRSGLLVETEDAEGVRSVVEYDGFGRWARRVRGGVVIERHLDVANRIEELVRAPGTTSERRVRYTYDGLSRLVAAQVDPLGLDLRTTYEYEGDDANRVALHRVVGPDGQATEYVYDARGFHVETRDGVGHRFRFERDWAGRLVGELAPSGRERRYERDGRGRVRRVEELGGGASRWSRYVFDGFGELVEEIGFDGATTRFARDAMGRVLAIDFGADGVDRTFAYDPSGQLVRAADAGGITEYEHDAANRLVRRVRGGRAIDYAYRRDGQLTELTMMDDRVVASYDGDGRLASLDRFGSVTGFTHGPGGELARVDRPGHALAFDRDGADQVAARRLLGADGSELGTLRLERDPAGRVVRSELDAQTRWFDYDALGRLVRERTESGAGSGGGSCTAVTASLEATKRYGPSQWFNGILHLSGTSTVVVPSTLEVIVGNAGNHLANLYLETASGETTRCVYKGGSAQSHPSGAVQIERGLRYHFQYCDGPAGRDTDVAAARAAALVRLSIANGDSWVPADEPRTVVRAELAVTECTSDDPAPVVTERTYDYDAVGNRVFVDGASVAFDGLDRRGDASYDAAGRIVAFGGAELGYDPAGNLAWVERDGRVTEYEYDARDQLVAIVRDGAREELLLDERGALPRVVAAIGADRVDLFFAGPDGLAWRAPDGSVRYAHRDAQDSVVGWLEGGAIAPAATYDAWGVHTPTPGAAPFGFHSELTAGDGTVHLRARSYLPEAGVFLQPDRFTGFVERPASLHRYAFVEGDPVNLRDPSGFVAEPYRDALDDLRDGLADAVNTPLAPPPWAIPRPSWDFEEAANRPWPVRGPRPAEPPRVDLGAGMTPEMIVEMNNTFGPGWRYPQPRPDIPYAVSGCAGAGPAVCAEWDSGNRVDAGVGVGVGVSVSITTDYGPDPLRYWVRAETPIGGGVVSTDLREARVQGALDGGLPSPSTGGVGASVDASGASIRPNGGVSFGPGFTGGVVGRCLNNCD